MRAIVPCIVSKERLAESNRSQSFCCGVSLDTWKPERKLTLINYPRFSMLTGFVRMKMASSYGLVMEKTVVL